MQALAKEHRVNQVNSRDGVPILVEIDATDGVKIATEICQPFEGVKYQLEPVE